ncbi:MAG: PAS domain S-box protein [Balneolaceae bacterium]|nr:PAS domain S-box protein [Balneolaceae bacterium]
MGVADYLLKDELSPFLLAKSITYSIERNRINRSLRDSKEQYQELFDLSPQPMWVYDHETLKFLDVNHAATQHYGYSREEFLSMSITDIRPEEDVSLLLGAIEKFKDSESLNYAGIYRHTKKDGTNILVEIHLQRDYL